MKKIIEFFINLFRRTEAAEPENTKSIEDLREVEKEHECLPIVETVTKYIEVEENPMLNLALSQYGISEMSGTKHNDEVLKYFREIGFTGKEITDETAWCGAFMNYIAKVSGREYTGKLDARSWLKVGQEIKSPKLGDIVVLWRESPKSWKGHVALFVAQDERYFYLLGGNQNNKVQVTKYTKGRLLGFRRLSELEEIA